MKRVALTLFALAALALSTVLTYAHAMEQPNTPAPAQSVGPQEPRRAHQPDPDAVFLGLLLKAKYALISGNPRKAITLLDQALALQPKSHDAHKLRIEALLEHYRNTPSSSLESIRAIARSLEHCVRTFPNDPFFPKNLAVFILGTRSGFIPGFESPLHYLKTALKIQQAQSDAKDEIADTYYYMGRAHIGEDNPYDAAEAFQRAYELDGELYWSLYYAADSYQRCHRLRTALKLFEAYQRLEIVDPGQGQPPISYNIALLHALLQPDPAQLNELIRQVQGMMPQPQLWSRVALRFHEVGHEFAALVLLEQVPMADRDVDFYQMYFFLQLETRQYERILREFETHFPSIQNPELRRSFMNYAIEAALLLRNYSWVLDHCRTYTPPESDQFRIGYFKGLAQVMFDGQTEQWETLRSRFQENDTLLFLFTEAANSGWKHAVIKNLVQFYMLRRDWQGAIAFLGKHFDMKNPPQSCWRELADLYGMAGEFEQALAFYEKLTKVAGQSPDFYNNYGYLLVEHKRSLDQAERLIQKALDLDPENPAFKDSLAWLYHQKGQYDLAKKIIIAALGPKRDDREKLDHLGDIYWAQGDTEAAKRTWSEALEASGTHYFRIMNKLDP